MTGEMCFDGTQVVFKEPQTLTVFRVVPIELHLRGPKIWIRNESRF